MGLGPRAARARALDPGPRWPSLTRLLEASRLISGLRRTFNLQLLLEPLQDAFEVVQLDVREEHAVEQHEQVGEPRIGRLAACLRRLRPDGENRLSRLRERVNGDHTTIHATEHRVGSQSSQ